MRGDRRIEYVPGSWADMSDRDITDRHDEIGHDRGEHLESKR